MGNANINTTIQTLQLSIKTHQQGLYALFNNVIRSSVRLSLSPEQHIAEHYDYAQPDAREAVLKYFAKALQVNVKRQGLQVDSRTVAGDGFMFNLQAVLLQLASPFIDAQYTKVRPFSVECHFTDHVETDAPGADR